MNMLIARICMTQNKSTPHHPKISSPPFAQLLKKLLIGTVVLGVLALALFSYTSWQEENQEMQRNLAIQASFVAKSSQATFDNIGISLELLGQSLAKIDVATHPDLALLALMDYKANHPESAAVSLVSPKGVTLLSTNTSPSETLPDFRQDAAYLNAFMFDLNNTYSYNIGRNQFGMGLNQWHFPFRHTVHDSKNQPLFVIQVAIPVESAGFLWSDLLLIPGSRIGLMRDDGYLQLVWPYSSPGHIFNQSQSGALTQALRANPGMISGSFEGKSSALGSVWLGAFSHLPNANMSAFVSVPEKRIMMRWWKHNFPILLSFLVYLGIISAITVKLSVREKDHTSKLKALASFPEGSPDIVLSTDRQANVTYINPHGQQILAEFRLSSYEIEALLPRDYRAIVARCLSDGTTVKTIEVEFNQRHLIWTFSPLQSEGIVHCYGVEITKRKKAEAHAKNALVEKQVAEAANQSKSLFLANMSHEIRTPLNGVMGFLKLLSKTTLTATQLEYLNTTEVSAKMLLTVINDILDFSKIEAGKVSIEQVEIEFKELLEDIISLHSANAGNKGLDLVFAYNKAVPARLLGDPARISQVLSNLLGNAIKFTQHGEILVQVELKDETEADALIEVSVKDSGIGISTEEQERLFQPFSQADASTTRKYGGTGLGLVISKALIELMGGKISVQSHAGQGSRFVFTLRLPKQKNHHDRQPLEQTFADAMPESFQLRSRETGEKLSVLIVDDNEINRKLVKILVEQMGAISELAENGVQALDACNRKTYDLILMDAHMPVMDGVEATARIRELEKNSKHHSLIIALTANALSGDRERYLAAGMDEYLSKPINEMAFLSVLKKLGLMVERAASPSALPNEGETITHVDDESKVDGQTALPLLDPQMGIELSLGDWETWREILGMLFDSLPEYATKLMAAKNNPDDLSQIAHKLAGASCYCGTPALNKQARKLERFAKKGDVNSVAESLDG